MELRLARCYRQRQAEPAPADATACLPQRSVGAVRFSEELTMLKRLVLAAGMCSAMMLAAAPAQAQSGVCANLGKLLQEREGILKRINGLGKKNVNPANACNLFTTLVNNGNRTIAFATENKDWCQIPDEFMTNLTSGQRQVQGVRGQACRAAQQQAALQQRARQQQQQVQQNGAGAFGGPDGFSSQPWRVPQGAL
ncbi:MAG: hypothetical protein HEQ16_07585 [Bosea sp.]|nr:hypothetical protein [Bosea sp. (in: a-proteobacteria)]